MTIFRSKRELCGNVFLAVMWLAAVGGFAQSVPFVHTQDGSPTAPTSTLRGMVVPNSLPTTTWFEWGTNNGYGSAVSTPDVFADSRVHLVKASISGLAAGMTYHFRVVGSNSAGVVYGMERLFRAESGGKVATWGRNDQGQWAVPVGLSNVVGLAGGYTGSLAVQEDGTVASWGFSSTNVSAFTSALSNIVSASCAAAHILALDSDGIVHAYGPSIVMNMPAGLSNVVGVAAAGANGVYYSLALKADGTVAAWGTAGTETNVPSTVTNAVEIAVGFGHSIALKANGTVMAWGGNTYGQLNIPLGTSNIVAIAAGGAHSLALRGDGKVVAWGYNGDGEISIPNTVSNVVAVGAGNPLSVVVQADGKVSVFGNINGTFPVPPAGLSNVVLVAGADDHISAVGHNAGPTIALQSVSWWTFPNVDCTIQLPLASDPNNDPVQMLIKDIPVTGALYQCQGGARGAPIMTALTALTDPLGRVIYAPMSNSAASVLSAFSYVATDGEINSSVQSANVSLYLPSSASFDAQRCGFRTNGFEVDFSGYPGAAYRVWATTNLADWELLGFANGNSNGQFQIIDPTAASMPYRFYRATAL
jgi:hypothetical protein